MDNKKHNCVKLPEVLKNSDDDKICISNDDEEWYLEIASFADEKIVEDGEAEEVGEELWSYEIKIDFCPFCGMSLKEMISKIV